MTSFHGAPWLWYILWQMAGFGIAFILNSFVEWGAHRFILHSKKLVGFAYELHHVGHHGMFGAGETYHAQDENMRNHVRFVLRDYILFLLATLPLWVGLEFLAHRPMIFGGILSTLVQLQMFNSFHWRYHVPSDTWFQRTRFFRFLAEHHRRHHGEPFTNLNVSFLPLADLVLGTYRGSGRV